MRDWGRASSCWVAPQACVVLLIRVKKLSKPRAPLFILTEEILVKLSSKNSTIITRMRGGGRRGVVTAGCVINVLLRGCTSYGTTAAWAAASTVRAARVVVLVLQTTTRCRLLAERAATHRRDAVVVVQAA